MKATLRLLVLMPLLLVPPAIHAWAANGQPPDRTWRNGIRVNPNILASRRDPVIGSQFFVILDCSSYSPGITGLGLAHVIVQANDHVGILTPYGELLFDPAGQRIELRTQWQFGTINEFWFTLPNDTNLCGIEFVIQGACQGTRTQLSNAWDMTIGG